MNDIKNSDFLAGVKKTVCKYGMLSYGDTVIIGLSGGADSVALTYALYELREEYEITIEAVHINHNIRGEEAERDELFVRRFCEKLSIPLTVISVDVPLIAAERKISCEQAGREVRYEAFNKQINGRTNCKIATAHTLSDLMETMLFNMTRGTGIKGLRGIVPIRDNIIRPLIGQTREQIEDYCKSRGLGFVVDSSNLSDDYTRNKIRHHVIPALYEVNPSLSVSMQRLSRLSAQDDEFMTLSAQDALNRAKTEKGYSVEVLSQLHPAVLSRVILLICEKDMDFRKTELIASIIKERRGAVGISGNKTLKIENGVLFFAENIHPVDDITHWEVCVTGEHTLLPDGRILNITPYTENFDTLFSKINKLLLNNTLICDTLFFDTVSRNRKEGDRFYGAGRNGGKTLKKLFNEQKIPVCQRNKRVILEHGGEIIWIEGIGSSAKYSPKGKKFNNNVIYTVSITDNKTEEELQ